MHWLTILGWTLIAVLLIWAFVLGISERKPEPTDQATTTAEQLEELERRRDVETIEQGGVFAGKTPDNIVMNGADLDRAIDDAMREDHTR